MNWFKKAYYKTPKQQLFDYIKQSGVTINAFHGTSKALFQDIKQKGYFKSPTVTKTEQFEERTKGLNQVFLSSSFTYATYYAVRTAQQTNSNPIIVNLIVPLYAIAEVQWALGISGPVYNEVDLDKKLKEFTDQIKDMPSLSREALKSFAHFISNQVEKSQEFTTQLILPDRFIKSVAELDYPADSDEYENIKGWKNIDPNDLLEYNSYNIKTDNAVIEITDPSTWFKRPYKRLSQRTDLSKEQVLKEIEETKQLFEKEKKWESIQPLRIIQHELINDNILPEIAKQSLEKLKTMGINSPYRPYITKIYDDVIESV